MSKPGLNSERALTEGSCEVGAAWEPDTASRLFPQSLEAPAGNARVVHGVARITMAEVILHGAQIGALVGEIVAARVPQRVRVNCQTAPKG